MEQLQQQQHVEDVGRILLQTQDQLRQLREQLTGGQGAGARHGAGPPVTAASAGGLVNNNTGAEIEEILQRAEDELRAKAELVLRTLVSGPGAGAGPASPARGECSLPLVRAPPSVPSGDARRRRRRTGEFSDPDASELDLDYFRQRFKPNTVASGGDVSSSSTDASPARRGGGLSVAHKPGKRVTVKTATHARLLPYLHTFDPAAPRPVLSPADAKQGVLSLLNRGFLPPNVDLTPAFQATTTAAATTANGVIQNGAVKLYRRDEQPVRAVPYSNPSNFNLATLKFDMAATNAAVSSAAASEPRSPTWTATTTAAATALNTVTIRFAGERSPQRPQGNQQDNGGDDGADGAEPSATATGRAASAAAPAVDPQHELEADAAAESDANSMDDLRKNVEKIRGYNELLDTYSLHQFIIHKGRAMRETPEFQSFRRVAQEIWGAVEEVVRALEALLTRYFVPLAYVDGQRLMGVAAMVLPAFPPHVLLSCVVNEDQVAALLRRPGQRYKGKDRKKRAATTLQAFFRMLVHRNHFRRVCRRGASATRIQTAWRAFAAQQALRKKLRAKREAQLAAWQHQMARLRTSWPDVARARRVVVHVPSLSLDERARVSLDHFAVQQNLQLARLAAVVDANVDVVYVAPFELPPELAQYVVKLLQLCGVRDAATRVTVVVPEHAGSGCFPAHWSLASLLLYSPRCLRRVQRLVRGREAYLVMGVPGDEDQRVALALALPLLGLPDARAARPLLSRAGAKRFFIKADVNVPTGTYDLYDVDELLFALAKLVISHLDQNVWLLRLDALDLRATGTARLDVSALQTLREIRREKKPPEYWKQPGIRDTVARALLRELERDIAVIARPCHPEVFPDWPAFAAAIARDGVVVEALPAVVRGVVRANLFVAPSGDVHVLSTQEALSLPGHSGGGRAPLAFASPQTLVPHDAVAGASQAVGRVLREEHAFCGFASVDLQLGREDAAGTAGPERLWAVGLHPFLTDSAASFATFHALHGGALDANSGLYHVPADAASPTAVAPSPLPLAVQEAQLLRGAPLPPTLVPRCYVGADFVVHPGLCTTPTAAFFHACRRHGVCFDVARRVGTVFTLPDSLTAGVFGVLSSGETPAQAAQFLRTALEVLAREVGSASAGDGGTFGDVLALLRHRAAAEKEREKELARQPLPVPAAVMMPHESGMTATVAAPAAAAPRPDTTPLLRVGKVDQMRRIRRTSQ